MAEVMSDPIASALQVRAGLAATRRRYRLPAILTRFRQRCRLCSDPTARGLAPLHFHVLPSL